VGAGTVIITTDGAEEQLRSLANWLRDEDGLRGKVILSSAPILDGRMGGAFDAVVAILTGSTVGTLVTSIRDWRIARRSAETVTLRLTSGGGRELELKCGSAADTQIVLDSARKFLEEGS
jgi:hypothetical protein